MAKKKELKAPNLGNMLLTFYENRRVNIAGLARVMNLSRTTVWKYHQRQSLQVKILWGVCIGLRHNFFADIAAQLPEDFTSNVPANTNAQDRIALLEAENRELKMQLDLLKEVMRK